MKVRVLVVDDVADQRDVLRYLLERQGYEVVTAGDGRQAMSVQRATPAQVLITDIFMPGQEGIETISHFRREWPDVRIIAVSGGGEVARGGYLDVAQTVGADAALRKPFTFETLLEALGSYRQ